MTISPFLHGAKVQTMHRDFERLRRAIRSHDSFAAEAAWDKCERWLGSVSPETRGARFNEPEGTSQNDQKG